MRPGKALDIYLSNYGDRRDGMHDLLTVFRQVRERFWRRQGAVSRQLPAYHPVPGLPPGMLR